MTSVFPHLPRKHYSMAWPSAKPLRSNSGDVLFVLRCARCSPRLCWRRSRAFRYSCLFICFSTERATPVSVTSDKWKLVHWIQHDHIGLPIFHSDVETEGGTFICLQSEGAGY
ncbi:hypothetical protein P879_04082 [Paragonimus westermani]|uniref:Uncharacterized protein n=1 Tax=Paragonimus westermani TaxID=34504 RepID=A0A8T0DKL0_9TREM|nr:hypothetical protein P879_04082 [Paragonimus westermani]